MTTDTMRQLGREFYLLRYISILVILVVCLGPQMARADDKERQAVKCWKRAKELLKEERFKEADEELTEALSYVGQDTAITLIEAEKRPFSQGKGVSWQTVQIRYKHHYNARELLADLRKRYPPKVLAVMQLVHPSSSDHMTPGETAKIKVELINNGESRATNFEIFLNVNRNEAVLNLSDDHMIIEEIMPGSTSSVVYDIELKRHLYAKEILFTLNFKEEFGYRIAPMNIPLEVRSYERENEF